MRIQHVTVNKLFGIFDHSIPLNLDDRITIIYGPNGFGKTFTLVLVNELLNPSRESYDRFARIPFDEISVDFDDASTLRLKKTVRGDIHELIFEFSQPETAVKQFRLSDEQGEKFREPQWLTDLKKSIYARFISTERLRQFTDAKWRDMSQAVEKHALDEREKIDLLIRIINSMFLHKQMEIDKRDGFVVRTSSGDVLPPDILSSGEKHLVVLLYELLFNVTPDSLILIDEPELSLHIVWQQEFLVKLAEIIELAEFDVLVATHSPQIIHDRWDLAVELKDPRA